MSLQQTLRVFELIDSGHVCGQDVVDLFVDFPGVTASTIRAEGPNGVADLVRIDITGSSGKTQGGQAPTLGIIGRLGGIGARPVRIGMVSDADGAITAIASALKLAEMRSKGDILPGDVAITTHICPHAPIRAHDPVDFMSSPIDHITMNSHEVMVEADAILSIDTTKGNRIINHNGYALSPTVKQGYILRVSEDLLRIMEITCGHYAVTFPITIPDITPCGNGIHHLNSILQPSTVTHAPVVGVAICTQSMIPGCATGASHETDIAKAVKFTVEVAKEFVSGTCRFYDESEFSRLLSLYGSLAHLQLHKHDHMATRL
ncbi:hypothetical protein BD65_2783 [Yersinia ruckeri]|uniref:DUF1177 domain-containing protein n=1 Tax=Yersinia ruckeri TaxID=29486 RepID=UPI0005AC6CCE|nr:DUF1177 domain-containing protein [Yersinia ruckeri]AJI93734.1 hypothetical protein BD65_2783 [Yersinia ruckeri]MCW6567605.1 DUF1177 domain-containing protein [Yersinia ruckeri]